MSPARISGRWTAERQAARTAVSTVVIRLMALPMKAWPAAAPPREREIIREISCRPPSRDTAVSIAGFTKPISARMPA